MRQPHKLRTPRLFPKGLRLMAGRVALLRAPAASRCFWRGCAPLVHRTVRTHSAKMEAGQKPIACGVVFDMDGTLLKPVIDFAEMRRRVGVLPDQGDILDVISRRTPEEQQRAYAVIAEIEEQALRDLALMPGALELCAFLDSRGIPRGLITRNVRRSVQYFHSALGLQPFAPAITRECEFPYKPSPAALHHISSCWGVPPARMLIVGDSAKDDVVCGNRAGAITVLLDNEGRGGPPRRDLDCLSGEMRPTHVVTSLFELQGLLEGAYQLLPPPHPTGKLHLQQQR